MNRSGKRAAFIAAAALLWLVFTARPAHAYAWMIRHAYTGCNQCHADPSGGGLLTAYGRAQSELLLRTRYGEADAEETPRSGEFLLGLFPLPEALLLGGDARGAYVRVAPKGLPASEQTILMQADAQGQVAFGRVRLAGSIGYADRGALPAALTHEPEHNVVSRLHWIGIDLGRDRDFLLRIGRLNLPFGIRNVEHTLWVRSATRTDTNSSQQHGVALAYNGEGIRGEVMAIAGNFQVRPGYYRAWGYSAYVDYAPSPQISVGASSVGLHAGRDVYLQVPLYRAAHGVFARASVLSSRVVLMAEADLLVESEPPARTDTGYVGALQSDWECFQGLHVMGTAEIQRQPDESGSAAVGGWASVDWFFAPHADLRLDAIWQNLPSGSSRMTIQSLVAQLHLFL
jgi:hypothetical protein